jgi:hypothetical protein
MIDLTVINAYSCCVHPPLWPLALICLLFPACLFLVSQSTAVFAFDLVICILVQNELKFIRLFLIQWNCIIHWQHVLKSRLQCRTNSIKCPNSCCFCQPNCKCFLSLSTFGICFKLVESMVQSFCFLASFSLCFLWLQLLLSFLK